MADVLLIKLGYVEEIPDAVTHLTSLSDVFVTSVLLRHFQNDQVTVVTARDAVPLFKNIPNVRRVLTYDYQVSMALSHEHFDVLVNLEPGWEFCALADSVWADQRFGFTLDDYGEESVALEGAEELFVVTRWPAKLRMLDRPLQALLYETVGAQWRGEEYVLGIRPDVQPEWDIAFNVQTDRGWMNRNWSEMRWRELESLCGDYSISYAYQEYGDDLAEYIRWIAGCRVLVTPDSLGMHLALALGKRVVALLGPTSPRVIHLYDRGEAIVPTGDFDCIPCYEHECRYKQSCLESIDPAEVMTAVMRQMEMAWSGHGRD